MLEIIEDSLSGDTNICPESTHGKGTPIGTLHSQASSTQAPFGQASGSRGEEGWASPKLRNTDQTTSLTLTPKIQLPLKQRLGSVATAMVYGKNCHHPNWVNHSFNGGQGTAGLILVSPFFVWSMLLLPSILLPLFALFRASVFRTRLALTVLLSFNRGHWIYPSTVDEFAGIQCFHTTFGGRSNHGE